MEIFMSTVRYIQRTCVSPVSVGFNHIKLPRIGWMKTYEVQIDNVSPKSVTINRKADRWFVSFKVDRECQITEKAVDVVGVDY